MAGTGAFKESVGEEYLENNCVDDPVKLCDFQLLENRIMQTVDSVYQVKSRDHCHDVATSVGNINLIAAGDTDSHNSHDK